MFNNNKKTTKKSRDQQQHLHMYDPYTSSMYQGQYYAAYLQQHRYGHGYYHGHGLYSGWYPGYASNIVGTTGTSTLLGRPSAGANPGHQSRGNKNKQKKTVGTGSRGSSPTFALDKQPYNSNNSKNKQATYKIIHGNTDVKVNVSDATNANSILNPNAAVFVPKNKNLVTRASSPSATLAVVVSPSPVKIKTTKITTKATDKGIVNANVQAPFLVITNNEKATKTDATTHKVATGGENPSALRATAYNANTKSTVKAPPGFTEPMKKPGNVTSDTTRSAAAPSVMSYAGAVLVSMEKGKLTTSAKPQDGMGTTSISMHPCSQKDKFQNNHVHEPNGTSGPIQLLRRGDDTKSLAEEPEPDTDNNNNENEEDETDSNHFAFTNPMDILRQRHGIVFAQDPNRFHK